MRPSPRATSPPKLPATAASAGSDRADRSCTMEEGSALDRAVSFEVSRSVLDKSTALVTVVGEIDSETAPRFDLSLSEAVEDKSTHGIVVDLSAVRFLDSSALNALIRCFERQKLRMEALC